MPIFDFVPHQPTSRSVPLLLGRCLAAASAICLLGIAVPCHAARPVEVVNLILTSRFLEQERCDNLGLVNVQLLQGLNQGVGVNQRPPLPPGQVRDIAARYVDIHAQLCDAITPMFSAQDAWASTYDKYASAGLSNSGWERFLSDQHAVRWASIAAQFRTELIMLNSAVTLALALRPDAFNPDAGQHALHSPATRKLLQEIRRVSLTDEEAKVRFILATLRERPAFRELMPARFDVENLARIEEKTRRIGLQFVDRYDVHLQDLYNPHTRMLLFTVEDRQLGPKLHASVQTATTQINALVSKYR